MITVAGAAGRPCARARNCRTAGTDIYVADTMGELGLFYRLSPMVFMGGSLVPHGGQNPIEADEARCVRGAWSARLQFHRRL